MFEFTFWFQSILSYGIGVQCVNNMAPCDAWHTIMMIKDALVIIGWVGIVFGFCAFMADGCSGELFRWLAHSLVSLIVHFRKDVFNAKSA